MIDEICPAPYHPLMSAPNTARASRATRFAWCLYDFANSAFPTVIITGVYILHFKNVVVGGDDVGLSDNLWGQANAIGALVVFLIAPLLGAVADIVGKKRLFLFCFTLICCGATFLMYFTVAGTVALAMMLVIVAVVGYEGAAVFYNSFLPDLIKEDEMGRLSGRGWALGYIGGLCCLLLMLLVPVDRLQLSGLIVAMWYLVFSIPTFLLVRDAAHGSGSNGRTSALVRGAQRLVHTLKNIRDHRPLARFLFSYFFYNNAVMTIIVFAVAFTADSLNFSTRENILLMIVLNVVAAPGAFFFGSLADRIGAKRTLIITLIMWLAVVAGAETSVWPGLFSQSQAKAFFWGVAVLASLCIGATQATSRGFVGQMAPRGRSAEFYGFMAFAGKSSAILGPLVFGLASDLFDSQRVAVGTIGVFFGIGLILLLRVPELRHRQSS
ncbi:MAG: MFS transporter [Myxococcota bacterium]|nr:MFS transporter [Myxococcota bacterium]